MYSSELWNRNGELYCREVTYGKLAVYRFVCPGLVKFSRGKFEGILVIKTKLHFLKKITTDFQHQYQVKIISDVIKISLSP